MNTIQHILALSALAMGVALPMNSLAQTPANQAKMDMPQAAATSMTLGEIKKVDSATGKVTIKHAEIKHLDMPGMTMVFTAKDKILLANVKPGDKINFMAVSEAGKMVVTEIQPVR
jgi:Cu(I)/Ag(I) efflux system protein CusF